MCMHFLINYFDYHNKMISFRYVTGLKLKVTPLFFLEVPHDAEARFRCECNTGNEQVCLDNDFRWSHSNQQTGNQTDVYRDGKLLGDPVVYEVTSENRTSQNLTIHGKWELFHETDLMLYSNISNKQNLAIQKLNETNIQFNSLSHPLITTTTTIKSLLCSGKYMLIAKQVLIQ